MRKNLRRLSRKYDNKDRAEDLVEALVMIETCRSEGSKDGPTKETASPFELILYWFSHRSIERFLSIKPCLFLFREYIGQSALHPKAHVPAKRREKRMVAGNIQYQTKRPLTV